MKVLTNKDGNVSKVKIGSILVGVSAIIGTIAASLQGDISLSMFLQQLIAEIGAVLAVIGIRDIPFLNKTK